MPSMMNRTPAAVAADAISTTEWHESDHVTVRFHDSLSENLVEIGFRVVMELARTEPNGVTITAVDCDGRQLAGWYPEVTR